MECVLSEVEPAEETKDSEGVSSHTSILKNSKPSSGFKLVRVWADQSEEGAELQPGSIAAPRWTTTNKMSTVQEVKPSTADTEGFFSLLIIWLWVFLDSAH